MLIFIVHWALYVLQLVFPGLSCAQRWIAGPVTDTGNRRTRFVLGGMGGERRSVLQHMYLWVIKVEPFNRL